MCAICAMNWTVRWRRTLRPGDTIASQPDATIIPRLSVRAVRHGAHTVMTTSSYRLIDPLSPYIALKRHFALIVQMARRDVIGRYRGSFAGLLWSFFNPLLMLVIYTFVFGVIFKARWSTQVDGKFEYAIVLFAGLNINTLFTECANRATTLIIDNTNFVKRV